MKSMACFGKRDGAAVSSRVIVSSRNAYEIPLRDRSERNGSPSTVRTGASGSESPKASISFAPSRKSPSSRRRARRSPFFSPFRRTATKKESAHRGVGGKRRNRQAGRRRTAARKMPPAPRGAAAASPRRAHRRICNQVPGEGEGFRPDRDVDPSHLPADVRREFRRVSSLRARKKVPATQLLGEDRLARAVLPLHKNGPHEDMDVPGVPRHGGHDPPRHGDACDLPAEILLPRFHEDREAKPDGDGDPGAFRRFRLRDLLDE